MIHADEGREPVLAEAPVADLLTGVQVGVDGAPGQCTGCGTTLYEGAEVTAYCYRTAEAERWSVRRVFCESCGYTEIGAPTLGAAEVLVRGEVALLSAPRCRTHRRVLAKIEPVAYSAPTEGTDP